ncbi:MAG: hypothetical protein NC924_07570, partial [Candidatus Omnitrophica bacterium]|nr:hypothetical protein [Candidatus Omnitrophota bacterium]
KKSGTGSENLKKENAALAKERQQLQERVAALESTSGMAAKELEAARKEKEQAERQAQELAAQAQSRQSSAGAADSADQLNRWMEQYEALRKDALTLQDNVNKLKQAVIGRDQQMKELQIKMAEIENNLRQSEQEKVAMAQEILKLRAGGGK